MQKQKEGQGELTESEVINKYEQLLRDCQNTRSTISQLEQQLAEHELVVQNLKEVEGSRKTYRLIGAVLAEQTAEDVLPKIQENKDNIAGTIQYLGKTLSDTEALCDEMRRKYGIRTQDEAVAAATAQNSGPSPKHAYMGINVEHLIKPKDEPHCMRLHNSRVYYISGKVMRQSTNISRDELISIGTCLGKFSKSGKFRLGITALDYMNDHALHKVWVKPSAELSFLYGNNIVKSGLARITERVPQYGGVVVYSMNNLPMGFGLAAQPTEYIHTLDPAGTVVLHQADIGEYLRGEDNGALM